MSRIEIKYVNTRWNTCGEGSFPIMIDAEERRCRPGIGLDTQLPYTVNDEW